MAPLTLTDLKMALISRTICSVCVLLLMPFHQYSKCDLLVLSLNRHCTLLFVCVNGLLVFILFYTISKTDNFSNAVVKWPGSVQNVFPMTS